MLKVETPKDLLALVGKTLGPSSWITVDQPMIDTFADATGDHQWIHVDVERAKREMPGGKTIAHGYLTLSLVPRLAATLLQVTTRSRGCVESEGTRRSKTSMKSVAKPAWGSRCFCSARIDIVSSARYSRVR